ncbi:MAG: hypothetical protein ABI229_10985, partial [Gemmatimonadaceae bacterium]
MTDAVLMQEAGSQDLAQPATPAPLATRDTRAAEYVSQFDEIERADEPLWLGAQRRAAIESFSQLGFPTTKNEDWHFTSVAPLLERGFAPILDASTELNAADIARFQFKGDWQTLVFLNGHFVARLSQVES